MVSLAQSMLNLVEPQKRRDSLSMKDVLGDNLLTMCKRVLILELWDEEIGE